jgi:CheY-like chemotaxis protein
LPITKVLIADNDPVWLAQTVAEFTKNTDYVITTASTHAEAKQLLIAGDFDVAIIDVRMIDNSRKSDVSGLELAKTYALDKPKIIVTEFPNFQSLRDALRRTNGGVPSGVDFIHKGEGNAVLVIAVERARSLRIIPNNPLFGVPTISDQFSADAFIIMPFHPTFDPVHAAITRAVTAQGLREFRGDDPFTQTSVIHDIWSALNGCRVVISDCTGRNANVYYELGIADTLGKPVIILVQDINDVPFDIRHRRILEYTNTSPGRQKLSRELQVALKKILGL